MDPSRLAVLGLDSGNTKTAALVVTLDGQVLGRGLSGPSNYQSFGPAKALDAMLQAALPAAQAAAAQGRTLAAFGFGLTGLDRPRDAAVLGPLVDDLIAALGRDVPVAPAAPRTSLNDAHLVLRAGTGDGAGVAASSGTGGNSVAVGPTRIHLQVGGLGRELGDGGGAHDIALAGLQAAGRARDGRGWKTRITDHVCDTLGLSGIEDILDFAIPGNRPEGFEDAGGGPRIALLAPLVFAAADEGDLVAREILVRIGRDLGVCARLAAARVGFAADTPLPLVLGGTVLMCNPASVFAEAIAAEVRTRFPAVAARVLDVHPVAGAALLAMDALAAAGGWPGDPAPLRDGALRAALAASVGTVA